MSKTDSIYMRIDPILKKEAEGVLSTLGLTPNEAINVFLRQVVLHNGLPFEVKVPALSKEDARKILITKLKEAEDSLQNEPHLTLSELKKMLEI